VANGHRAMDGCHDDRTIAVKIFAPSWRRPDLPDAVSHERGSAERVAAITGEDGCG
jgi:hypothetical protein